MLTPRQRCGPPARPPFPSGKNGTRNQAPSIDPFQKTICFKRTRTKPKRSRWAPTTTSPLSRRPLCHGPVPERTRPRTDARPGRMHSLFTMFKNPHRPYDRPRRTGSKRPERNSVLCDPPGPGRPGSPPRAPGGARRDRTDDLMLAKHALSQLSYGPVPGHSDATRKRTSRRPGASRRKANQPPRPVAR